MIVCLCKGVSCRTIRAEVRRGNSTVKGIAQVCQAGRGCGACVKQIQELIVATGGNARGRNGGD